jgi:predicted nucleic acid-binding protein
LIVVADSSPLIFLAKLDRLSLLTQLYGSRLVVPEPVKKEVIRPTAASDDVYVLEKFLQGCTVLPVRKPRCFARALSEADNAALTLAVRKKAERLLVDERLLRRIAEAEGIVATGTLGILFAGVLAGHLTSKEAEADLSRLVRSAGFRISIAVYEAAMDAFKTIERRLIKKT